MIEYTLPTTNELIRYLQHKGWRQDGEGPGGTAWAKDDHWVGIPAGSGEYAIRGAIERIAPVELTSPKAVADAARYLLFDITHLRAANDFLIVDTIPLETAGKIIRSARTMLRATATTARYERGEIRRYSPVGDAVIHRALMGHTERGSFIIPVLVRLSESPEPDPHQPMLEPDSAGFEHRTAPEPFERRVVRTFAQSMQALQKIVVEPAKAPTRDQVHELVYRGVSREFCRALAGILDESAVAQFEARVDWAPSLPAPESMPQVVGIDADAVDLVKDVAEKLRQQKTNMSRIFSGTIVQLRHDRDDDPFGEIAVSTVRRGHQSEILVRLPMTDYRHAWEWHDARRAVLVEGIVEQAPGRQARVNSPIRCQPIDDIFTAQGP